MSAIFVRPSDFTVVSANQAATGAALNTSLDEPGMVWRSNNLSGVYVIIDLGANAGTYDTVAIVGSNLRASDTVQLRTGTSASGTGAFDIGAPAFIGNKPDGWSTKTIFRIGDRSERYIRLDISAPGHPAGFVEVQRIVIGKAITTLGIDIDAEQTVIDQSNITTVGGYDIIEEAPAKMGWKFSMSWVNDDSWRNEWLSFATKVRKVQPVLFVPFFEDASTWQQDAVFGRFRTDPAAKSSSKLKRALDIKIEGLAL